jgi:hypothetical protein
METIVTGDQLWLQHLCSVILVIVEPGSIRGGVWKKKKKSYGSSRMEVWTIGNFEAKGRSEK